jgi:UDPglucose--hexose-1-phosphate uridylyltransferase
MPEFRKDPLTGRWRIIAEGRLGRPNKYAGPLPVPRADDDCPFCEGREERTPPELAALRPAGGPPNGPGWTVRAIPNRYPTVSPSSPSPSTTDRRWFEQKPATGIHEVIIEAPRHSPDLPYLAGDQLQSLFRFFRDRVRSAVAGSRLPGVILFENRGPESGGTLPHPHAQLIATEQLPPRVEEELQGFRREAASPTGGCLLESMVKADLDAAERVISSDGTLTAFAPFASEFPYEVWIAPRRHASTFSDSTDEELDRLAQLLPALLRSLDAVRPGGSYNWFVHGVADPTSRFHWHLEIAPRWVRADGYDLGAGMAVNPVAPEAAAAELRQKLAETERSGPQKP